MPACLDVCLFWSKNVFQFTSMMNFPRPISNGHQRCLRRSTSALSFAPYARSCTLAARRIFGTTPEVVSKRRKWSSKRRSSWSDETANKKAAHSRTDCKVGNGSTALVVPESEPHGSPLRTMSSSFVRMQSFPTSLSTNPHTLLPNTFDESVFPSWTDTSYTAAVVPFF